MAKGMMSKKAARLYGRMQHGIAKKHEQIEVLQKRRKEIESTKEKSADGKTFLKKKVERLKSERKSIEKEYNKTGGSMKRKKQRTS
jgi:pescadillo protein